MVISVGYGSRTPNESRRNRSVQESTHTAQSNARHEAIRGMSSGMLLRKWRVDTVPGANSEVVSNVESAVGMESARCSSIEG
jgi:hypothetical protein